MNEQEVKRMIGAVCPELNLDRCYPQIMPRVTVDQLGKLLDVAERGDNAETWSHLAVKFLQYGQQEVIATHIDRLVTDSGNAAWVLVGVHGLSDENRNRLVSLVTDSGDACWLLREVPSLAEKHQDALVLQVKDSRNACWVLEEAPHLTDKHRKHLRKIIMGVAGVIRQ